MPRKVSVGFCVLVSAALFAVAAPAAHGANTWEGVWNSDFGRLTMSASGSGSYEGFNPGTISGPAVGNVNEGTWNQPGDPPKKGTYRFELSAGGQSFTGTWAYDTGGCGTACGWNGTCIEGACLENSVGGGDDGDSCKGLSGPSEFLGGDRADSCPGPIRFNFRTDDGLPDKPAETDLPRSLLDIEVEGSGKLIPRGSDSYQGEGNIEIDTEYAEGPDDKRVIEGEIRLEVEGPASYRKKEAGLRRVDFSGLVAGSSDDLCDYDGEDAARFDGALAVNGDRAAFRLTFAGRCVSSKPLLWKSKHMRRGSIKGGK